MIAELEAAVNTYPPSTHPSQRAQALQKLGTELMRAGKTRRAITTFEEAVRLEAQFPTSLSGGAVTRSKVVEASKLRQLLLPMLAGAAAETDTATLAIFLEGCDKALRAELHLALSRVFAKRRHGDRAENMESALRHCHAAVDGLKNMASLQLWAQAQLQLGRIYRDRLFGDRHDNADKALAALRAALQVFTRDANPYRWGRVRNTMGTVYQQARFPVRPSPKLAAEAFTDALNVLTAEKHPDEWAGVSNNLGMALLDDNRPQQGIAHLQAALAACSMERTPKAWAELHHNLGRAYRLGSINPQHALWHYSQALRVHTIAEMPWDHRRTIGAIGMLYGQAGDWVRAHDAFDAARRASDVLLQQVTTGVHGIDEVLRAGHEANDLDAYALAKLGRASDAVEAVERGRAYGLVERLRLHVLDMSEVDDPQLRDRVESARDALQAARRRIDDVPWRRAGATPTGLAGKLREARRALDELLQQANAAGYNVSLSGRPLTIADVPIGIVYLLHTEWGGLALAVHPDQHGNPQVATLWLPELTDTFAAGLAQTSLPDGSGRIIGGYALAQEGVALNRVLNQWPGATIADRFQALCSHCDQAGITTPLVETLETLLSDKSLADAMHAPYEEVDVSTLAKVAGVAKRTHLSLELRRCLPALSETLVTPLAARLRELDLSTVTLVPCGVLPAFPLASVPIGPDLPASPAEWTTFADAFSLTVAPSARRMAESSHRRTGVFALGNPLPTHHALRWGEAEAHTVAALGGDPGLARTGHSATRAWLLTAMREGRLVAAACHGRFDGDDILNSGLLLANGERLTLADSFALRDDISGLPLLILSACQAATVDLHGARSEVRSLPTGMLQAGVRSVLAPVYSVDDHATYLLVTAFVREYLQSDSKPSPAQALSKAAAWVRKVTNSELADAVPHSGERYSAAMAATLTAAVATHRDPAQRPYVDPIYWAGFQVYGSNANRLGAP
ncbi:CHAT domain-containing protein [Micromonospora sp. DT62]|uniref:CHAT domain-containing protein n=1 Tax=Micromonospora sp. DT62 TaxID=3416521 RepID=UPI003CED8409